MRQFAILQNNEVIEIKTLNDAEAQEVSRNHLIIDIEDEYDKPEVGWILDGNKLVRAAALTDDEASETQQKAQRLFGKQLAEKLVDLTGALNLKLAKQGTVVNVAALLSNLNSIKALLETGALKTARTATIGVKPSFPVYDSIFQLAIDEITNFLVKNGYE